VRTLADLNPRSNNSHYKNRLFENSPTASFQKADFSFARALDSGKTKIGFIMRIAVQEGENGAKRRSPLLGFYVLTHLNTVVTKKLC
jgi:hypothetical protein